MGDHHSSNVGTVSANISSPGALPLILVLGPPGSGKGTLCKKLAKDYHLHQISVGGLVERSSKTSIAAVPEYINRYVLEGKEIPSNILIDEFGSEENSPPGLTFYNCGRRNTSTPESMKISAMPMLRAEIELLAQTPDRPNAVLLDNLTQSMVHVEAAGAAFGLGFPNLVISTECLDETAGARFESRARGNENATKFALLIARYRRGIDDMTSHYHSMGVLVRTSTESAPDVVYASLLGILERNETWRMIVRG